MGPALLKLGDSLGVSLGFSSQLKSLSKVKTHVGEKTVVNVKVE